MKKVFGWALAVSAVLTAGLTALYAWIGGDLLLTLMTTAGTTFYHFFMRLVIGCAVEKWMPKRINVRNAWFREHSWEPRLYRFLRVRKWARKVPTFKPEQFDIHTHTSEELARQMCLSELVHEWIVLGGFFTLFFCLFFEDPLANLAPFLITAVLAGLYDMQFVILQRYNRPKVLRLSERVAARLQK